jgi:dihydrofolate synthase/folylpolyglutamate synthase
MFLERMQDLLDRVSNPEEGFKYIHITGTAGKGSVSSIVHATLSKSRKKVGLFTSPFTVSTIEKIQVGDKFIDPIVFAKIVESLKIHIDNMAREGRHGIPSYFEIIFAVSLIYFKKEKCEYVVLEVGLGGRYDATNIIKNPLITAVTNIGLDHTQILGTTTEKIAFDKAGIIKKGSKFFTTEDNKILLSIFKKECEKVGAIYHECEVDGLNYEQRNELLAGSICIDLGIIDDIRSISVPKCLPARFELVARKPNIIIDGAHNPSKIATTVFNLSMQSYKRLFIVVAISADKDWKKMMEMIIPLADYIYVTRFGTPGRQCVNPKEIFDFVKSGPFKSAQIALFSDPIDAFLEAKNNLKKEDLLLVTGSFYLAGDIRALYCSEEQILKRRKCDL